MSFLRLPPDLKQVLLTSALLPRFRLNPRLWPQLARQLHLHLQNPSPNEDIVPLRKQLKKEAKQERALSRKQKGREQEDPRLKKWELTVGIEIHAQLNTKCKLFSSAETSISDPPNTHIAFFDLALPGSQPRFQKATLLPAVRAALALNCEVQCVSRFDRKHYFYQDQPNGYQITQYYEPFARNGTITLYDHDGIDPADGKEVSIGIKQIQMEQDTAKTIQQPPSTHLLDFNRVSHPLIEIITLPHIHHPATAAAYVKKIQTVLRAVNVNTTGIEMGGLRADVNVSVRRRDGLGNNDATHEYSGIKALGQRVEIKNLVSFKAVEDAIVAERNRQINLLENGRVIDGETRGWNLGDTETRRLRGKEGEVDYRYMPDPDLAPVIIGKDLLTHLRTSLPVMPDEEVRQLVEDSSYGVNNKDAKTLVELDDGARLEYYKDVVEILQSRITNLVLLKKAGRMAANWVLMELGGLLSKSDTSWEENPIPTQAVADIVHELLFNRITGRTAKQLLPAVFEGDQRPISQIVEEENLIFSPLPLKEYEELVKEIMRENPDMVEQVRKPGGEKKVMWFVGQMMRRGEEGRVEANKARVILEGMLLKEG
ncbi:MAG: hypothetical protein M1834_008797 [Cirrosporium novae-zelandiae]|nr:MAG: hypothetical protein M1834_008797 [Cirrosporium novae-zelandiae]